MKEHILAEIKRIAKAHGRVPGKRAFERETGIKEHQWSGVFWAKWSEALEQAGCEPNQLQVGYTREGILSEIAKCCREFKHFPTAAEMKLYGRAHPAFPNHRTIQKHFNRGALVEALTNFVEGQPEYSDIAPLLPALTSGTVDNAFPSARDGLVYMLKSGDHYKIGRSATLERRVKQITVSLPQSVELVHAIRTDDPTGIEAYWHRRFSDLRANGEWFKLGSREVAAFKKRRYQ